MPTKQTLVDSGKETIQMLEELMTDTCLDIGARDKVRKAINHIENGLRGKVDSDKKKSKNKRLPSNYNNFVHWKVKELKEKMKAKGQLDNYKGSEFFMMASMEWKSLSPSEKDQFRSRTSEESEETIYHQKDHNQPEKRIECGETNKTLKEVKKSVQIQKPTESEKSDCVKHANLSSSRDYSKKIELAKSSGDNDKSKRIKKKEGKIAVQDNQKNKATRVEVASTPPLLPVSKSVPTQKSPERTNKKRRLGSSEESLPNLETIQMTENNVLDEMNDSDLLVQDENENEVENENEKDVDTEPLSVSEEEDDE